VVNLTALQQLRVEKQLAVKVDRIQGAVEEAPVITSSLVVEDLELFIFVIQP
jgi:hypothetical protein